MALRKEGMSERHWIELSNATNIKVNPETMEGFTFQWLVDQGMLEFTSICQEIGERASKEYRIQKGLEEMEEQWKTIEFKLQQHKKSQLVTGFDDIEAVLDEHLATVGSMMVNPFNKFFYNRIDTWNDKIITVDSVIGEWRKFQSSWAYLSPIFASDDISRHMPQETMDFKQATKFHKTKVSQVQDNPNAMDISTTPDFLTDLKKYNADLENIQNELNTYLETKRKRFARFYFLADDELLSIVSQTKEVERVQDHLRKVFEGINRLHFDGEKQIHAMLSVEGERVNFTEVLDPVGKQVEDWMLDVESEMKKSVKESLNHAVETYLGNDRIEWTYLHPGQTVLNGSQVHYTHEVETAIKKHQLKEYVA